MVGGIRFLLGFWGGHHCHHPIYIGGLNLKLSTSECWPTRRDIETERSGTQATCTASILHKNYKYQLISNIIILELELIQTQMTQKPMLRAEVGMRVRCAIKASAECIMRGRGIGQNSRKNCKKRGICG